MSRGDAAPLSAELDDLDIAIALPLGIDRRGVVLEEERSLTPREAFRSHIRDALLRPPCVVSFSGGRDSSAVLATAVAVARDEGLPMPVPATLTFPDNPESHESEWQELVLEQLGVTERIVYEFSDELDTIGPYAQRCLRALGVRFPSNLHLHLPMVESAAGGSLLTGFGGDELAMSGASRWAERIVGRRRVRSPHEVLALMYGLAPQPAKYVADLPRSRAERDWAPWLTRRSRLAVSHRSAVDRSSVPFGWGKVLREWVPRARYFTHARRSLADLGRMMDVEVSSPFVEPRTLQAFAAHAPLEGINGRRHILELLVADLLPSEVIVRQSKAAFTHSLRTDASWTFAREWDGIGLDHAVVEPTLVRASWLAPEPTMRSMAMMQQAWLSAQSSTTPVGDRG